MLYRRRDLLALPLVAAWPIAGAQTSETLRLLVGYPPGGAVDAAARQFAPLLAKELGEVVVVENRPGANGTLAGDQLARSKPDGNTLWFAASSTLTIVPHIMRKMAFDATRDIAPVAPLATFSNVLLVGKDSPYRSVKDLVAFARAHPGAVAFGSAGIGSSAHLSAELFADRVGARLLHVPYKGSAPAMTDLMAGQLAMMFDIIASARPQITAGRVRALAVSAMQRNPALPDVPTFAEEGISGFDVGGWYGLYAPAGLAPATQMRLNDAARRAQARPELQALWDAQGYVLWSGTPEELARRAAADRLLWKPVTQGISLD